MDTCPTIGLSFFASSSLSAVGSAAVGTMGNLHVIGWLIRRLSQISIIRQQDTYE
jgi:hypothetical protein